MKLGFIGTGNMAGAIMGGIIGQGIIPASEIIGSDVFAAGREKVKEQYGICLLYTSSLPFGAAESIGTTSRTRLPGATRSPMMRREWDSFGTIAAIRSFNSSI